MRDIMARMGRRMTSVQFVYHRGNNV